MGASGLDFEARYNIPEPHVETGKVAGWLGGPQADRAQRDGKLTQRGTI